MEIFRLNGRPNYHISDDNGGNSYCNNARRYKLTTMGEDMRMYEEVDGVDTKNYTGEEKLCQSCVAKAYQNGKITVIPIEDGKDKNNI